MAAALQKEMKVSMTEEATTSFTRLDWGAEKVWLEGMKWVEAHVGLPRPDANAECMCVLQHSQLKAHPAKIGRNTLKVIPCRRAP